ncbi:hypothetical protein LCGC14_1662330 [marine sediment metagenome]|uniref:Uncharacterized protein n=1 Tax=marine sediment metagenome TaxID=412755 RepID=A0A0F9K9K3_9ZZZZ
MSKQTGIKVQITEYDNNIFTVMEKVTNALSEKGYIELASAMWDEVNQCDSYKAALAKINEYVELQ